jgi:hypothetical protein
MENMTDASSRKTMQHDPTPPPTRKKRLGPPSARRAALGAFVVLLVVALAMTATAKPGQGQGNSDDDIITVSLDLTATANQGQGQGNGGAGGPGNSGGQGDSGNNSGDDAVVTVVFDEDGLGYNVTSTKDLSNIVVDFCVGDNWTYDDLTGLDFAGSENRTVAGLWVKSGNNGDDNDTSAPAGAGVYVANADADCAPDDPTCEGLDDCEDAEVPFFTSPATLLLGASGAIAGVLAIFARKRP